jgi:hypothetical protein
MNKHFGKQFYPKLFAITSKGTIDIHLVERSKSKILVFPFSTFTGKIPQVFVLEYFSGIR